MLNSMESSSAQPYPALGCSIQWKVPVHSPSQPWDAQFNGKFRCTALASLGMLNSVESSSAQPYPALGCPIQWKIPDYVSIYTIFSLIFPLSRNKALPQQD